VTFTAASGGSVTLTATAQSGNGCSATTTRMIRSRPVDGGAHRPRDGVLGAAVDPDGGAHGLQPLDLVWSDGTVQGGITFSPATRIVSPSVDTTYASPR